MKYLYISLKFFLLICISTILCQTPVTAASVNITGYDIQDAVRDGFGWWGHYYTGTITDTGSVSVIAYYEPSDPIYVGTVANYTGGGGTLNDGVFGTTTSNTQLFATQLDVEITLFFDQEYFLQDIYLYSHNSGSGAGITGNITSFDVTAGITNMSFTSLTYDYDNYERINLIGSGVDSIAVDNIVLSNFVNGGNEPYFYAISEIVLTGSPVPIPGAIWLLGSGLIGIVGIRRKFKK